MRAALTLMAVGLSAASCASTPNPCGGGQAGLCVAIEVRGNVNPLDEIDLSITVLPARTLTASVSNAPNQILLPVQFAAFLPADVSAGALEIDIVGARAGIPIAIGTATTSVPPSGQRVKIELVALPADGGAVDLSRFRSTDMAFPPGTDLSIAPGADLSTRHDLATPACAPTSCTKLGLTCGTPSDGCGRTLSCGPPCQLGPFSTGGTLSPGLTAFGIVQIGKFVYLLGGQDASQTLVTTVARATVNDDGTLGTFAATGVNLTLGRASPWATVANGFVYVTGGLTTDSLGTSSSSNLVERAPINPDNSLGQFVNAGVTLGTARDSHVAVAAQNFLYVIGGEDASTGNSTASVEVATINADGSLSAFAPSGSLTVPRSGPTVVLAPGFLYVIGGGSGNTIYNSIERAVVNANGSLGVFADAGIGFVQGRFSPTSTVVGSDVYLVGGETLDVDLGTGVFLGSVEHATLNGGGTLSSFSVRNGVTLATPRDGHGTALTGNSLYVIGGFDGTNALDSIERALLQ